MNGGHLAGNRCLHFGFHFHGFGNQHGLAGFHHVAFLDQYVDDIARHRRADMARLRGVLALAAATADKLVERFEHHFFRHAVDGQVEVTLAFSLHANTRNVDAVAFAVHVDNELGRHAFATGTGHTASLRDRQQHFRGQGAGVAFFEELATDVREHGVGQHVFFGLGQRTDFAAQLGHFRLEQISRSMVDHVFAADRLATQFFVHRARRFAVAALQVELHFVGDGLVAFAGQHIEERLGANDLRSRRHQWRETEVFTHPWDFSQHFAHAVECALLFQLVGQVGNHPARHLVDLHTGVDGGEFAFELVVFLTHGVEVQADFLQQFQVEAGVELAAFKGGDHRLGARMAGAPGKAGDGGVDVIGTVFDGFELAHRGQTSGVVGVNEDRQTLLGLQRLDQLAGGVRSQQAGHVFDGHRVATHGFHLLGLGHKRIDGVHRAGGVGDGALGMFAGGFDRLDGHAQVTHVVHCVEDAEHVDAVDGGLGDKSFDHIVAVVPVAQQVLTAQQHLQTRVRQCGAQFAQALPRVFFQKAYAGVEGRAAPDFQGPVADFVELVADRQHVVGAHAGGQQRLVGVAQDGVGYEDLLAHSYIPHRPAWAAMAAAMARASSSGLRLIE